MIVPQVSIDYIGDVIIETLGHDIDVPEEHDLRTRVADMVADLGYQQVEHWEPVVNLANATIIIRALTDCPDRLLPALTADEAHAMSKIAAHRWIANVPSEFRPGGHFCVTEEFRRQTGRHLAQLVVKGYLTSSGIGWSGWNLYWAADDDAEYDTEVARMSA